MREPWFNDGSGLTIAKKLEDSSFPQSKVRDQSSLRATDLLPNFRPRGTEIFRGFEQVAAFLAMS